MQQTQYYNLNLPEGADRVDIEALNANSDVIDIIMHQIQAKAEAPVYYSQVLNTPSSLPASDVYPWAKASTRPTYTASDVGTLSSTTINQMVSDLNDRINEVDQKAANVESISDDQILSLFDSPYVPDPSDDDDDTNV